MQKIKLDSVSKIITIISVTVGIFATVAGYFATVKTKRLEDQLKNMALNKETVGLNKEVYNLSPRISAKFELPLARAFAELYLNSGINGETVKFSIPPELSEELETSIPNWQQRKGLMTGKPCEPEGLNARQVITLLVKNIGYADAVEVSVKAKIKLCPNNNPLKSWQELSSENKVIAYYDLQSAGQGWVIKEFPIEELRGQSSPEKDRNEVYVVLASVSGTKSLYGTIIVPLQISWKDKMTGKQDSTEILTSQKGNLRSALLGSEIGRLSSACK